METLADMITRHEGVRIFPYLDCCGRGWKECVCMVKGLLTIGVGRCIDRVGITQAEAFAMRDLDIATVLTECEKFPFWGELSQPRKNVVADMVFALGFKGLLRFPKMLSALDSEDYDKAASEILSSTWASQVKGRAVELATMMRTGA